MLIKERPRRNDMTDIKIVEGGECDKCNEPFSNDEKGKLLCGCPENEDIE